MEVKRNACPTARGVTDAEEIGYQIKKISDMIRSGADHHMKKIGLTFSQSRVLRYLRNHGGSGTQRDIENFLQVSHPTVVGLVARMEKNGLVACHKDEQDKRNKIVCLTEKAISLEDDFVEGRKKMERCLVKDFTKEEEKELRRLLQKLTDNLEHFEEEVR